MDGRALAARIREELKAEIAGFGDVRLATVLVGDDPASQIYIRLKHKAAEEVGIQALDKRLPQETPEEEVLGLVEELNDDDSVDGVLVQTPLPPQIDEPRVMRTLDPMKDVDGLHPFNAGQLFFGQQTLVGATPVGVMRLLAKYKIPVAGARAVVVGRCRCSSCTRTRQSRSATRARRISRGTRSTRTSSSRPSARSA